MLDFILCFPLELDCLGVNEEAVALKRSTQSHTLLSIPLELIGIWKAFSVVSQGKPSPNRLRQKREFIDS